jgi:MFS family permease
MRALLIVFCPFAAGFFLSFFFRNINAVISKDLVAEFALTPANLGFLTSMYLLAFAAFQLPLGVLLDRYGPRRVVAALLCVAAVGATTFGLGQGFVALSIGRALIGIGVSAGLMGAIKAFSLWFPLSRLASLNGAYFAIGGTGGLFATAPAELLLEEYGWRPLFTGLAFASLLVAVAIFLLVPEKKLPIQETTIGEQIRGFDRVFRSVDFWRIALPLIIVQGSYYALQGLWLAPWLVDVVELDLRSAANYLFITATAYTIGSVVFGMTSDRLADIGIPRTLVYKCGLLVSFLAFVLVAMGVETALGVVLTIYAFSAMSASLAYSLLTFNFPASMTGRVNTASNVLLFGSSFAFQWGIGLILKQYPVIEGRYSATGYTVAFMLLAVAQAITILWLCVSQKPEALAQHRRGVDPS